MYAFLIFAAVFIGFILIAIIYGIYSSMTELGRLQELPPLGDEEREADADQWASQNGFRFDGNFYMPLSATETFISLWRHSQDPGFFCDYLSRPRRPKNNDKPDAAAKRVFDLVTVFENDRGLTTSNTKDGQLLPPAPGNYKQTFSTDDLDDLYQRHQQAVEYLVNTGGAGLGACDKPAEQVLLDSIRETTQYIRSLPLWPIRGIYWYLVRQKLRHNLSIQQQHEKGKIKLPNELRQMGIL